MSDRPHPYAYASVAGWHEAYRKARMTRVPNLFMIQSAYEHDEIDVHDLERLTEAALTGTAVEIPETVFSLRFRSF